MNLKEFVEKFAAEFDETPAEEFKSDTDFKALEEWGSLTALSIIAMVEENMDKLITGAELRSVKTIEDLYNLILAK